MLFVDDRGVGLYELMHVEGVNIDSRSVRLENRDQTGSSQVLPKAMRTTDKQWQEALPQMNEQGGTSLPLDWLAAA